MAVEAARDTFLIDQELQSNADAILAAEIRIELLDEARSALTSWVGTAQSLPQNEVLSQGERWRLNSLAVYPAAYTRAWTILLDKQPVETQPRLASIEWINQIVALIDEERPHLSQQITWLESKRPDLTQKYTAALQKSLSLSPALTLEGFDEEAPEPMRSPGLLILIGSICGLLIWLILQLVLISRKKPRQ